MRSDVCVELRELRVAVQRAVNKADTALLLDSFAALRSIRDALAEQLVALGELIAEA
jgi:hypothetical protein